MSKKEDCHRGGSHKMATTKLRGYLQVKHNPSTRRSRLPRKAWRRQWVVLDIVETMACPALIGRIYNSHIHEDKTLPSSTVTLTDVHGLHRAQSRSHPYAFSLDGSCQCLILSGNSETESQLWMRQIRDVLWPRAPSVWLRSENSFEVSLIDNVHSDIARLRGFYGQLVVDGRDVLLVEARSGADQIRWPIKSLKKWFCPKVATREDKDKIIVIITHKNCSSGEGIFTFYCRRSRELVARLTATSKNQPLSSIEGKKSTSGSYKMNPILALLRRGQQHNGASNNHPSKKSMSKSASSADHLDKTGGFEAKIDAPVALGAIRRGFSLERPLEEKKKSASESNLLSVSNTNLNTAQDITNVGNEFPAPPNEEELQRMSISATLETVTGEGFYRSFDDLDDIDDHLMSVLADSNPLEAAVVLRNGENLSQNGNGRNSFNSSDSGRMSDTYAETSNSSVTSSSAGHNRLHSNMSNCSGDSGAQLSLNSNDSKVLEVLKEQESPDLSPFDQEIYGQSVSISSSTRNADGDKVYQTISDAKNDQRFATVRKSHTLPHGMSSSVASTPTVLTPRKRKDLSNFLGLNDEGPGSPSKEVAQSVAMQNLPQENCNEKIEKYLGINQDKQSRRPRPKSLHGLSLERSMSIDQQRPKTVQSPQAPLSKTLARLQKIKDSSSIMSAPTTPNTETLQSSPRKRHLAKFLGYNTLTKDKKQSNLSKSMDLESKSANEELTPEIERNWQSNEALVNSGSGGLPTPMEPMSPAIKKIIPPSNGLILRVEKEEKHHSASSSPFHGGSAGRPAYHTSSLQRGGLGTISKNRPAPPPPQRRMMPRSATLDDLEPPPTSSSSLGYYEPVMWVQRGMLPHHTCCCSQYRCHQPQIMNGSLPRYHHPPPVPAQDYYDYPRPHTSMMNYNRGDDQQVYLSMTRTKRVVVIPINGNERTHNPMSENVVQIPLRETAVDSSMDYMMDPTSKVVSMGNKTCISVNESSLVSTKAIVHQ